MIGLFIFIPRKRPNIRTSRGGRTSPIAKNITSSFIFDRDLHASGNSRDPSHIEQRSWLGMVGHSWCLPAACCYHTRSAKLSKTCRASFQRSSPSGTAICWLTRVLRRHKLRNSNYASARARVACITTYYDNATPNMYTYEALPHVDGMVAKCFYLSQGGMASEGRAMPEEAALRAVGPHEGRRVSAEPRCPVRAGELHPDYSRWSVGTCHPRGTYIQQDDVREKYPQTLLNVIRFEDPGHHTNAPNVPKHISRV